MDYRIHVLDVCHTPDERLEEFPPDIRTMFLFIKYKDNPAALMEKLKKAGDVRPDTCEAIADIVGERKLKKFMPNEEGGKVSMCKAIQILVEDGELRGEKRGEKRGFKRGIAQERKNTESERRRADAEKVRADSERTRADSERIRADSEKMRAEKAEARIRELEQMLSL